jgi:hypothetical protein
VIIIFRKPKKKEKKLSMGLVTKAALWLHNKVLVAADSLNKKINAFPAVKIKWGLVVFCLLFGALSSHTIYQAFQKDKKNKIVIQPIRLPVSTEKKLVEKDKKIIEREYLKIKSFQLHMQELKKKNPQKSDSLLHLRPGLMDSVETILKFYETQLNN